MEKLIIDGHPLRIEDVEAVALKKKRVELEKSGEYRQKIDGGAAFLDAVLEQKGDVYGVTTGYGDSCSKKVARQNYYDLPVHLTRFHGCGMGDLFDEESTRAALLTRLQSLSLGYSGVSYDLLKGFENLLHHDILPRIPQEGSVGASGDLTPLSYIGAVLIGEREVLYKNEVRPALEVLNELNLPVHKFRPKEALAIMNGTAMMTAVACLAFKRAGYLAEMATKLTSMMSLALKGNNYHFDKKLFDVKPHPGQRFAASRIRRDLNRKETTGVLPERIQDPYSIRCAPHVIGVFYDAAPMLRQLIEQELNSANDNPVIDPETQSIFHGGHFYGGHIAFAMDSLKNIIANISDLLDRQLAVLVDEKFNRGLPPNLSGAEGRFSINHGFKAVQIAASAWTAEALKNTMPASVFSRSTECHNQDKVSMGTIAARDCIRVLELTEQTAAACLLAANQALHIRRNRGEISAGALKPVEKLMAEVDRIFPFLVEDRPMDKSLRSCVAKIRAKEWIFYHDA